MPKNAKLGIFATFDLSFTLQVVMSVAQLYHHVAPKSDVLVVTKSLIRLLRSHREVQSVVLNSIASISVIRKVIFVLAFYHFANRFSPWTFAGNVRAIFKKFLRPYQRSDPHKNFEARNSDESSHRNEHLDYPQRVSNVHIERR